MLISHSLFSLGNVSHKIPKFQGEEKYVINLLYTVLLLPIPTKFKYYSHIITFILPVIFPPRHMIIVDLILLLSSSTAVMIYPE